jgi:hypothetical protein
MQTFEIGENTSVLINPESLLIQKRTANDTFSLRHLLIGLIVAVIFLPILVTMAGTGEVLVILSFISVTGLLFIGRMNLVEEVTIDLKTRELRKTTIIFNTQVHSSLIYPKIDQMHYAWMAGERGGDDEPRIDVYELVAYKNKHSHKALMFFIHKDTTENLNKIFKEKLNVEIHDRVKWETWWTHEV